MSRLIFEKSYIIVEPSYSDTEVHRHAMLHIFLGRRPLTLDLADRVYEGNMIFLKNNIFHKSPVGKIDYIFLVDPTSTLADEINRLIPINRAAVSFQMSFSTFMRDKRRNNNEIAVALEKCLSFTGIRFSEQKEIDKRISDFIEDIKAFKYLGKKVVDIANKNLYSESWLTHLFKREAGVSLKSYLLMRQLEYVWQAVYCGQNITMAFLDAGFSSPSHFAAVCKKMTGISISDAL